MAKQTRNIKVEQIKDDKLPDINECHSPDDIVGALQRVLHKHKGWKELLSKSLRDAHENAKKNLTRENYKRFMLHPATTLEEYYSYLKWL